MELTASKLITVFNFPTAAFQKFQLHFLKYVVLSTWVRTRMFNLLNGHLPLVAIVPHPYTYCMSVWKRWYSFMFSFYVLLTAKKYTEAVFRLVIKISFLLPSYFPNLINKSVHFLDICTWRFTIKSGKE